MKKIFITWVMALMPVVSFSQSYANPILENWQAIEYENLKTGEITFVQILERKA